VGFPAHSHNKTGTVSLTTAMEMLGFTTHNSAQGFYIEANKNIEDFLKLFKKGVTHYGRKLDY